MFHTLRVSHFRSFPQLELTGLSRVTLFVGRNNCGKTSVLEAAFLLCGGAAAGHHLALAAYRGLRTGGTGLPSAVWRPMFYRGDPVRPIEIAGRWADGPDERRLTIAPFRAAAFPALDPSTQPGSIERAFVAADPVAGLSLVCNAGGREEIASVWFDHSRGEVVRRYAPSGGRPTVAGSDDTHKTFAEEVREVKLRPPATPSVVPGTIPAGADSRRIERGGRPIQYTCASEARAGGG